MTKAERLSELIGVPAEAIESDFDEGMLDILIELNRKNYFTIYCCEGHPATNSKHGEEYWNAYLAFASTYKFPQYPKNFFKVSHKRTFFYWQGNGEENRQEFLKELLNWAKCLPTRELKKVTTYHLIGKHKNQPNREKLLAYTTDYEEIRCIMNRSDINKYTDFVLHETVNYV